MRYFETKTGFAWGPVEVTRITEHFGQVVIGIRTARQEAEVRITQSGLIRVTALRKRGDGQVMSEPTADQPHIRCQLHLDSPNDARVLVEDFERQLTNGDDLSSELHAAVAELQRRLNESWPPGHSQRVIVGPRPLRLVRDDG